MPRLEPSKLAALADKAFQLKNVEREEELNLSIGKPDDSLQHRLKLRNAVAIRLLNDPFFVPLTDGRYLESLSAEHGLPADMPELRMQPAHDIKLAKAKIYYDSFDRTLRDNFISAQIEQTLDPSPMERRPVFRVKMHFGSSSRVRAEMEKSIGADDVPSLNLLGTRKAALVRRVIGKDMDDMVLLPWSCVRGNSLVMHFLPAGDRNTLIQAKLDA